jgi:flavin reductase (DIM6/NTAB) family NADH-FMN oxidoreductase RutF
MNQEHKNSDKVREFRSALGQYPTGVAIVTAIDGNLQPVGMTINSFTSVSLAPALVSWCIDHRAASYRAFEKAKNFTVTVLAEHQRELAIHFATPGVDKFRGIEVVDNKAPIISSGCAWFKCDTCRSIQLGDHTLFVGKVVEFARYQDKPLIFRGGEFLQPGQSTDSATRAAA